MALPANTYVFFQMMNYLASLNLFPVDDWNAKIFGLTGEDDTPYNDYFDFMGYSYSNFIMNMGPLYYITLANLLF